MSREHLCFITGKLAAESLGRVVAKAASELGFAYTIDVLPINVAALMTPGWVARQWRPPAQATRAILPGYCQGDDVAFRHSATPIHRGPRDLRELPGWLGGSAQRGEDYGEYDIEILAEINHAPRLALGQLLAAADELRRFGADVIDVGCDPDGPWSGVGEAVRALRDAGHRVSIDSLDPREIQPAVEAGAELVLSVNARNRHAAPDWGCEVVVIPDDDLSVESLEATCDWLEQRGVACRLDPVLEPIGMGFVESLKRYIEIRKRRPQSPMMMGIGNLTELTDVDSAGVNVLLLAICQELGIRSVLTTQVIPWARTSVRECDRGRRLVHYALQHGVVPKRLEPELVMLRDAQLMPPERAELERLATQLKDGNYRLFADGELLHLVAASLHLADADPFTLFQQLLASGPEGRPPKNLDPQHAFYLGYELCKALTANTLGKQYRQDESLDWGLLTRPEVSHRERQARGQQGEEP
ncbi:MAG: dihydropteroate synthase [Planctomycetales bacterium]|nr:dihydropteroate synthase [Planctomycetales bacterium]